ncbi:MAG: RluA family pseudouridine synthase [Lachnospiraceae bacterium]|nr:RluA family pseudouridine synthase [Lachnospiraceae bacterium]
MEKFVLTTELDDIRLDKYLSEQLPNFSRSYLQNLIKDGFAKVDKKRIVKTNYKLRVGEIVELEVPEPQTLDVKAENIPLDIIYEDEDVLIVNKPKDMVVHPAAGHDSGTLVHAALHHCQENLSGINGVLRPGIVHRIDKKTTGSLIICKNDMAHHCLANQLKEHRITRIYHAIVYGNIKRDTLTIHKPIGRHPVDRKKMSIHTKSGRDAVTHLEVLERFGNYTYVACRLETGRTHQIRVHLSAIGHPILGDAVYGRGKAPFQLNGQTLHAKVVGFVHPRTLEYVEFDTELPAYFIELLQKLRYNINNN